MLVWHLMTHMSGPIRFQTPPGRCQYRNQGFEDNQRILIRRMLRAMGATSIGLPTRHRMELRHLNRCSGRIVEVVSGLDLEEYFQQHILGPLA